MTLNLRHVFLWIGFLLIYIFGISLFLAVCLKFNAQLIGISGLVLMGGGLMLWWSRIYQRQLGYFHSLRQPFHWQGIAWAVVYAALLSVASEGYDWYRQWQGLPESIPENQQLLMSIMRQMPWLLGIFAAFIAPVLEELLFRGLLFSFFGDLQQRIRRYAALVVSSLLFALPHALPTEAGFVVYVMMGALLGMCYLQTRQLKYAILAHVLNNTVAVVAMAYELQFL